MRKSQVEAKQRSEPTGVLQYLRCAIHSYETTNENDWIIHVREYSHDVDNNNREQAVKGLIEMFGLQPKDYMKANSKQNPALTGGSASTVMDPKLKAVNELLQLTRRMID